MKTNPTLNTLSGSQLIVTYKFLSSVLFIFAHDASFSLGPEVRQVSDSLKQELSEAPPKHNPDDSNTDKIRAQINYIYKLNEIVLSLFQIPKIEDKLSTRLVHESGQGLLLEKEEMANLFRTAVKGWAFYDPLDPNKILEKWETIKSSLCLKTASLAEGLESINALEFSFIM